MIFGFLKSHYPRQLKHKAAFLWLYFFVLAFVFLILASLQDEVSFLFSQPPINQSAFEYSLWASLILKVTMCVLAYLSIKREFMLALLSVFNIKIAFNYLIYLHNLVSAWHYNAVGFVLLACTGSRDPPIEVCCGIRSGFWCNFVVGVPSLCRGFFSATLVHRYRTYHLCRRAYKVYA